MNFAARDPTMDSRFANRTPTKDLGRGAIGSATLRRPGLKLSSEDIVDIERLNLHQEKRLQEISR